MTKEAIILAGGFGTRLKGVVYEVPKSMAMINDKPFLEYQLNYLEYWGINHVILSVGYKAELIKNHFQNKYKSISIEYVEEKEPLGTGGAIKLAMSKVNSLTVFVLNGDTLFDVSLKRLFDFGRIKDASVCIALRFVPESGRYGSIKIDSDARITGFVEKADVYREEFINGGIYCINTRYFKNKELPEKLSIEKDFFEKYYESDLMYGFKSYSFFMDIGTPEDYKKAQNEFKSLPY